jgi:two-component system alkaline phosphatase synthesis response regulator PhoP
VLRRRDEAPRQVSFGDLELDFERVELRRAGVPVELTPIEFKLLSSFVRNPGRVLSRQQLLDRVWGAETYITERVVDTHVGNLRKKIESEPKQPRYLVSVLGVGYRFERDSVGVKSS